MYIKLDIQTEYQVKSHSDLTKFKKLMRNLKIKRNKSQITREKKLDR
ncbi:IS21 family transposase, partial [Bacillus cereus]|nr:IS21 family transposase [Bacillus cereus]